MPDNQQHREQACRGWNVNDLRTASPCGDKAGIDGYCDRHRDQLFEDRQERLQCRPGHDCGGTGEIHTVEPCPCGQNTPQPCPKCDDLGERLVRDGEHGKKIIVCECEVNTHPSELGDIYRLVKRKESRDEQGKT